MGYQNKRVKNFELINQFLLLCVLTAFMGTLLSGCGQPGSVNGQAKKLEAKSLAKPALEVPRKNMSKDIVVSESHLADVIIVIDNSASMRFEQANMADRFSSLLEEMKGLDWRLGIITTDVSADAEKKDGRFLVFEKLGVDHLTSQMDLETIKSAFAETIQRPQREGNSYEQGVKATYRALERNPNWLRQRASLNVVVVTDANETPRRGKAESRNNPDSLIKLVKAKNPDKAFFFHSIIVKEGDQECLKKDDNESYGLLYAGLSEKTGGIVGDVCEADYSKQLKMIGEKVSQQIKSVKLDCEPIAGSVRVQVQGMLLTDFVISGFEIQFASSLPVGSTQIQYQCY